MPVVPDLPFGLNSVQQNAGPNPLDMMGKLVDLRNANNQNQQFQQTFAARQRAGMIISHAGNEEAAVKGLMADPLTAGFAPEYLGMIRGSQETATRVQGEQQQQGITGLNALSQGLAPVVASGDTSKLPAIKDRILSVMPKGVQSQLAGAADNLTTAFAGLSPEAAKQLAAGTMFGAGMSSDSVTGASLQKPGVMNIGDRELPYSQGTLDGTVTARGAGVPVGVAPQIINSPTSSGANQQNVLYGGGGGNPFGVQPLATGPSSVSSGVQAARGKELGDYQSQVDQNVTTGISSMKNLQEAQQALKLFKPGAGASTWQRVAELAGTLGADQGLMDRLAGGNYAAGQEFQKLMVNNTMNMISQMPGTQGHVAYGEIQGFMKANPHIDTDPRAIEKLFNFTSRVFKQSAAEQEQLHKFLKPVSKGGEGGDIEDWPVEWAKRAQKQGFYTSDPTGTGGGDSPTGKAPDVDGLIDNFLKTRGK